MDVDVIIRMTVETTGIYTGETIDAAIENAKSQSLAAIANPELIVDTTVERAIMLPADDDFAHEDTQIGFDFGV